MIRLVRPFSSSSRVRVEWNCFLVPFFWSARPPFHHQCNNKIQNPRHSTKGQTMPTLRSSMAVIILVRSVVVASFTSSHCIAKSLSAFSSSNNFRCYQQFNSGNCRNFLPARRGDSSSCIRGTSSTTRINQSPHNNIMMSKMAGSLEVVQFPCLGDNYG